MKPIQKFIPGVTKKVYQNYGFSRAEILSEWPLIVGSEFAKVSLPEKISWPTRKPVVQNGRVDRAMNGASLRLRVEPHAALDMEYQSSQIIERINQYFGYRAITRLSFVQGPVRHEKPETPPTSSKVTNVRPVQGFKNEGLATSLAKLARSIKK